MRYGIGMKAARGAAFGGVVLAMLTAASTPARADGDAATATWVQGAERPASAKPKHESVAAKRWYGGQTLIADGMSFVTMVAGASNESFVSGIGVAGYLIAPPVIHGAHGNGVEALISVLARFSLPPLGFIIACPGTANCAADAFLGGLVGWGAAVILDGAVLAWEVEQDPLPKATNGPRLAPSFVVLPRESGSAHPGLGVVGRW